jgi:hypothetical protein
VESPFNYFDQWQKMPEQQPMENAFKHQWEMFLTYLFQGGEFQWNLKEGAKGVQLAELGIESWQRRAWMNVPPLE